MAKEKPKQYEDALGSIYDFIFAETKKSPVKVKPVKVTGIDGTSEFADALIATLENPLLFVNKSTMSAFEEVINYDLLSFRYGTGERDKVKFNVKDIPKALKDPTGFLDKAFAKYDANRKVNKALWAGDAIQGALGGIWARKHGLDRETVLAMSQVHRSSDRFKQTANFDPTKVAGVGERTGQLIDKHLVSPTRSYTLVDFKERYGSDVVAKRKFEEYKKMLAKATTEKGRRSLIYDKNAYVFLEGQDIRDKAEAAEQSGDILKAENYYRARRQLDSSLSKEQREINERKNDLEIEKYKTAIRGLRASSDPDKDDKIAELEREIKSIRSDRRLSAVMRASAFWGKADGFISSLKATANINLGDVFITGAFFDPSNKSWANPLDIASRKTLSEAGVRGFSKINVNGSDIGFKIAKTSGSRYSQAYNDAMLKIYYNTPVARIKSLFNGELYAYKVYENMNKFQNKFGNSITGFDMSKLINDKGEVDDIYLDSIISVVPAEQVEAITKFLKKDERLRKIAYRFNTVKRWQDKVSGYFDSKIGKKAREKIANLLLQSEAFKKFSSVLLKEWVEKGGVQVLGKAIGTALSGVLGPLGMVVGDAIASAAMKLAQKIAKPVIKLGIQGLLYSIIGLIGILVLFFSVVFRSSAFLSVNSNVAPVEVVKCNGSNNLDGESEVEGGDFNFVDLGADVPIFSGSVMEIYNKMAASMGLGTQLELVSCPGHRMCSSIDWAWCYSADKIYCRGDKLSGQSNATLSKLFAHELLHQVQGRNMGGAPSVVREWGADLLAGNGGGYKFKVNGQCVTATSTKSYFLSRGCSEGQLSDLARNVPGAISSSCGSMVASSINFCR